MDANLTFRPAKYEDWKLTYRFKKGGLKNYVEKIWGWNENDQIKFHKENFEPGKTQIIIYKSEDMGYLTTKVSDTEIYIENLIIGMEFRNKGLGTMLMNWIIDKAKKQNKAIGLRVLKTNKRAEKFYESLGFQKISESEYHYELKNTGYNST